MERFQFASAGVFDMQALMPLRRLARVLGVSRSALLEALATERMADETGHPTSRAINWGYARTTHLSPVRSGAPVARWHTRRCMRLVGQAMPTGRDWDLLLMAEEVEDVLAACTRLESSSDTRAVFRVLATLDEALCAEIGSRLAERESIVVEMPRRAVNG